jgi:hypothetical protein
VVSQGRFVDKNFGKNTRDWSIKTSGDSNWYNLRVITEKDEQAVRIGMVGAMRRANASPDDLIEILGALGLMPQWYYDKVEAEREGIKGHRDSLGRFKVGE